MLIPGFSRERNEKQKIRTEETYQKSVDEESGEI